VNKEIIAIIAIVSASAIILPMVWRFALSLLSKLRGGDPKSSVESDIKRSADAKPARETVAYVGDIQAACGNAPADFVLECLSSGMSRDEAREARIKSLEGGGK
jgi:hypothetical protein